MKYLKFMPYRSLGDASRNKREIRAAKEYGYEVYVFSTDSILSNDVVNYVDGLITDENVFKKKSSNWILRKIFGLIRLTTRNISIIHLANFIQADIWSCHDLGSLRIAFWAKLFSKKKPKLIYDSHEYEVGRYAKKSNIRRWLICIEEKYLSKRCAFVICVNDSIADKLQQNCKLLQRPIVVRSTPENWLIDEKVSLSNREKLLKHFPSSVNKLIMFHGNLGRGNGIEHILPILCHFENVGLVLMGRKSMPDYYKELESLFLDSEVNDRVLWMDAVPYEDIWKYVSAIDVEFMLIDDVAESYYLTLPNKFFESVQSLVPIISSKLPELKEHIEKYDIGYACDPNNESDLISKFSLVLFDEIRRNQLKGNLVATKEVLCWEEEKKILFDAFSCYL